MARGLQHNVASFMGAPFKWIFIESAKHLGKHLPEHIMPEAISFIEDDEFSSVLSKKSMFQKKLLILEQYKCRRDNCL